jgi:hypothetical protein
MEWLPLVRIVPRRRNPEIVFTPSTFLKARRTNAYLALGIAMVAEVIATTALEARNRFTRGLLSALAVAGHAIAF